MNLLLEKNALLDNVREKYSRTNISESTLQTSFICDLAHIKKDI